MRKLLAILMLALMLTLPFTSAGTQYINTAGANQSIGNNDLLYLDNTNGKIGIGIINPGSRLEVKGAASENIVQFRDSGGTLQAYVGSTGQIVGLNGAYLTGNSYVMNGNLGIGTGSPTYPLTVGRSVSAGNLPSGGTWNVTVASSVGGGEAMGFQTTTNNVVFGSLATNKDIIFAGWNGATNAERMRINGTGSVGIGTAAPSTKLHLYESAASDVVFRMTPANGANDAIIQMTGQGNDIATEGFRIQYDNDVGDVYFDTTYNNDASSMHFRTKGNQERLTILGSGNVGVGVSSPTSGKLQVNGGASTAGYFTSTQDSQITLHSTDTWTGITFDDSGGTNDYLWYNGAFGTFAIGGGGSSVSGKKLHVDGGLTVGANYDATAMGANGLAVEGAITSGGNTVWHAGNDGSLSGLDADTVDSQHYNANWPTTLANIQSATTNDFHNIGGVDDDTPDSDAEVPNAITVSGGTLGSNTISSAAAWSVTDNLNIDGNTLYVDGTNNRVGIGTTNPQYNLDITGNSALWQSNYPSDDSMVINMPFSEGTGTTTYDKSAKGNDGTLAGTYSWTTGKYGNALSFTNGYVSTGYTPRAGSKSMSYWVYYNTVSTGDYQLMGTQEGTDKYFYNGISNGGQGYAYAGNTGGAYSYTFSAGQWYQVAMTMEETGGGAGITRYYVNGVQVDSRAYTLSSDSTLNFYIGKLHGGAIAYPFNAKIDEVHVYSRTLSADEIKAQYLQGLQSHGYVMADKFKVINTTGNELMRITSTGMGVGTSSPSELLHLNEAVGPTALRLSADNYGTYWKMEQDSAGLNFHYNGAVAPKMIIDTSGNVGIANTAPLGLFDVDSDGNGWYVGSTGNTINRGGGNVEDLDLWINYVGYNGGTTRFRDFRVGDGKQNTVAFFDGSARSVGIGTTSPQELLHVGTGTNGETIRIGSYSAIGEEYSSGATVVGDNVKLSKTLNQMQIMTTHASYGARALRLDPNVGMTLHATTGAVTTGTGFSGEIMRVTNAGILAVGTTQTSGASGGDLVVPNARGLRAVNTAGTDTYQLIGFNSANRVSIDPSGVEAVFGGNVGVGITDPVATLHVYKASDPYINIETGGGNYPYLQLTTPSSGNGYLIKNTGTGNSLLSKSLYLWNSDGPIQLVPSGTAANAVTIDTTGRLGIGTATPSYKLEAVTASTVGLRLQTASSTVGSPQIDIYDAGRAVETVISSTDGTTAGTYIASYSNHPLMFASYAGSTPTAEMTITNGNVGIGTTSPVEKLHVMTGAAYTPSSSIFGGSGNVLAQGGEPAFVLSQDIGSAGTQTGAETALGGMGFIYISASDYNNLRIGTQTNSKVIFRTNNVDRMTIATDGSVGIGTTNPSGQLQVYTSDTTGSIRIGGGNGAGNSRVFIQSNGHSSYIDSYGDSAYQDLRIEGRRLLLNSANGGNVGIGTASPGSKLTVGTDFATTTGITVDTGGSSDSAIVLRKAAAKPTFGVLAWDSQVYLSAGTYYDAGSWIQNSDDGNNLLFVLDPGGGARWYASNNGAGSWNVASDLQLWEADATAVFPNINTGQGETEVYLMNQNVRTTDAVTFATLNTGQGAYELYAMNQNVQTTNSPTFAGITLTGPAYEGAAEPRTFRNLAAYNYNNAITGAMVITTNIPQDDHTMITVKINVYGTYSDGGKSVCEITTSGYWSTEANGGFMGLGKTSTCEDRIYVRMAREVATGKSVIILGEVGTAWSYPHVVVKEATLHYGISDTYATGWTVTNTASLAAYTNFDDVPDKTTALQLKGSGSGKVEASGANVVVTVG